MQDRQFQTPLLPCTTYTCSYNSNEEETTNGIVIKILTFLA